MAKVILTRYLYQLDEVLYSLQQAILNKTSFKEIVFWTNELFESGYSYETWQKGFEIYCNFYAVSYPKYENKFVRLHSSYKRHPHIKYVLNLFHILFYSKLNLDVFKNNRKIPKRVSDIYLKIPDWVNKLPNIKNNQQFVLSIHNKQYQNIAYYLYKTRDYESIYKLIVAYFSTIHNMELKQIKLDSIPYDNKRHICLATILYLFKHESEINKRAIFIRYKHEQYSDFIAQLNTVITPVYRTLEKQRKWGINPRIGYFNLARYNIKRFDIETLVRNHWEYFAYRCPRWKKRFKRYKIKIDDDNMLITFQNNAEEEQFYNKYDYEFDEQSQKVQNKSICKIPCISCKDWIRTLKN